MKRRSTVMACHRCGAFRWYYRGEEVEQFCQCDWPEIEEDRDLTIGILADQIHDNRSDNDPA